MFSSKLSATRTGICLAVAVIVVVLFFARSNFARQSAYDLVRCFTVETTRITTFNWEEIDTPHYIIKFKPVDRAYAAMVGDVSEEAYKSVTGVMGKAPDKKTTVVIYPDSKSLALSFGWDKNEKALGVYWEGTIRILSPGEYLYGNNIEAKFRKEGPMVHELTHLMVDDLTQGNYNRWWTEGMAQYVEKKTTGFEFTDPFAQGRELQYYDFDYLARNFDNLDQQVAYWQSLKAVEFIADRYGEQSLFAVLERLGQHYTMDQSIKLTLGINMKTFQNEFGQYVKQNR